MWAFDLGKGGVFTHSQFADLTISEPETDQKNLALGPEFKLGHMGGTECCHHISTHAPSPKKTERDLS